MKPFIVGRVVILVFILATVFMIPLVNTAHQTPPRTQRVTMVETRVAPMYADKNDVLFQRVIAELVKTFYIA